MCSFGKLLRRAVERFDLTRELGETDHSVRAKSISRQGRSAPKCVRGDHPCTSRDYHSGALSLASTRTIRIISPSSYTSVRRTWRRGKSQVDIRHSKRGVGG